MKEVTQIKKKIDEQKKVLVVLNKKRNDAYYVLKELEQKYYPLIANKLIGKCYLEQNKEYDNTEKTAYYYKLLKVRGENEFYAECIEVHPSSIAKSEFRFLITTYHHPLKMNEIKQEQYERMKATMIENMKKGMEIKQ